MSINFPTKQDIQLKRPPLSEVICQVKFPPILRISKEIPVNFQEAIRSHFPGLDIEQGVLIQLGISPVSESPVMESAPKIFRFKSPDSQTNVSLAIDFFALSTKAYTHWGNFRKEFLFVEQAARTEFSLPYTDRIGLRFINRFTLKNTGCKTLDELLDIFRSELTCLIRSEAWTEPNEMISQIVLSDNGAKLNLRFGLGKEQEEQFVILDFDYFENGQFEFHNLSERIDRYHEKIYQAFRWFLNDSSLERFEVQMVG